MYLAGEKSVSPYGPQLGFVTTAFNALGATSILKNLFGIGKKKAALKSIEQSAAGKFTSQLPVYADWEEYLSRPATNPKAKAAGAKTMRDEYNFWRGRKDSILIKHQIATPEDYAAWLITTHGISGGTVVPSAKPGHPMYENAPFVIGARVPIFDYEAVVKWAEAEQARLNAENNPAPAPVPVKITEIVTPAPVPINQAPQTPLAPQPQVAAQPILPLPPQFIATPQPSFPSFPIEPVAQKPAIVQAGANNLPMIALAIAGGAALYFATRKKGR